MEFGLDDDQNVKSSLETSVSNMYFVIKDGVSYKISDKEIQLSGYLSTIVDLDKSINEINLNNIQYLDNKLLEKIIYFMHKYTSEMKLPPKPLVSFEFKENVDKWVYDLLDIDTKEVVKLSQIANYMDIKPLLEVCCAKIAIAIKGKTKEQVLKEYDLDLSS